MILFQKLFELGVAIGNRFFPKITKNILVFERALKFFIAGGFCGVLDVAVLFAFVHYFEIHYLLASILAFLIAFGFSFYLHKNWTFQDSSTHRTHVKIFKYLIMQAGGLVLNTILMYVFVDIFGFWYILSQIVIALSVAVLSYTANKLLIFDVDTQGHNITVLIAAPLFPPDSGGPALHAKEYFERFPRHGIRTKISVFSRLLRLPFGVRHIVYLIKLFFKAVGTDLIYSLDATSSGWAAWIIAKVQGKPLLMRIGGDLLWERLAEQGRTELSVLNFYKLGLHKKERLYGAVKHSLKKADHTIVPTKLLADLYTKYYEINPEMISVISNPVPERIGNESRCGDKIVFASRLVKYKNIDLVLDAIERLKEKLEDTRFVIMGDGPELSRLQNRVRSDGIEKWAEITGRVSEERVLQETKEAKLTIGPASTEFSPNTVLRGLAYGKPFLISEENGLPFEIPGMLKFNPESTDDFTSKLLYILTDEGYAKAKSWIDQIDYKQSWNDVIDKNIQIVHTLLK